MRKLTVKEKAERRRAREERVAYECYLVWKKAKAENPEKYPEERPALNRTQARYWKGYSTYWAKCKFGHIAERTVEKSSCPVCGKISKSIRDAKIREGNTVRLTRAEKDQLAAIYAEARRATEVTGVVHHVDHIRPLSAGGVHHPDNLRVITAKENLAKGSSHNGKRRKYSRHEKRALREKFVTEQQEREKLNKKSSRSSGFWDFAITGLIAAIFLFAFLS